MDTLNKDARGFVDGVVRYLKSETHASPNIPKVRSYLMRMTASARRETSARVESSVALTNGEKVLLRTYLTGLVNHTVTFHYAVDARLVAGLRIRIGDWVVDTTLVKQLDDLSASLL